MASLRISGEREFASQEEFVRQGRRCGTQQLNEFQKERVRTHLRIARAAGVTRDAVAEISIPVHFHVIHDGASGQLTDAELDSQLAVLNAAFGLHMITFHRASVDRTDDSVWFQMTMGSAAERKAKQTLGKDRDRSLNFYTAGIGASLLGWATFPSEFSGDPELDGVVVLFSSLPGGSSAPYDLGMTAVHEVGHWLGLYHTFEGGCIPPGDEVADTPFEASPNLGPANPARDTCPSDTGTDPTTNYMDYTDDAGMTEFTPGQVERMRAEVALYRPLLMASGGAKMHAGHAALVGAFAGEIDFETGVI